MFYIIVFYSLSFAVYHFNLPFMLQIKPFMYCCFE